MPVHSLSATRMLYREAHGARVPALGLGTYRLTGQTCRTAVQQALELGYRHLDTARDYGNEMDIGYALAQSGVPRDELFITTKIWMDDLHAEHVLRSVNESLLDLELNYLDLVLIHWPNRRIPLEETIAAFLRLQEQGLIRHFGVSNFPSNLLSLACDLGPVFCNQVEYHPFLSQARVLETARQRDVLVTAYSPLAQGAAFPNPTLEAVARRHGRSAGQVALRWLLQQPGVIAIPKAADRNHQQANWEALNFELSADDIRAIDELPKNRRLIDPAWKTYEWDE